MIVERYEDAAQNADRGVDRAGNRTRDRLEKALLGAVMTVQLLPRAPLTPEMFQSDAHQIAWAAILAVSKRGDGPDLVLVLHELSRTGLLGRAGGPAYVSACLDSTSCDQLGAYARLVQAAHTRRIVNRIRTSESSGRPVAAR